MWKCSYLFIEVFQTSATAFTHPIQTWSIFPLQPLMESLLCMHKWTSDEHTNFHMLCFLGQKHKSKVSTPLFVSGWLLFTWIEKERNITFVSGSLWVLEGEEKRRKWKRLLYWVEKSWWESIWFYHITHHLLPMCHSSPCHAAAISPPHEILSA